MCFVVLFTFSIDDVVVDQSVSFHVEGEMVTPGEGSGAEMTLEWLGPCVLPVVPGELIRPREFPSTSVPGTLIGLLTCVGTLMGLQMGTLGIDLVTSREVAAVYLSPLETLTVATA